MLSRFLRRMPLWQVPVVLLLGLGLAYLASRVGLGGWIGDTLALVGILLCFVAIIVGGYGHLYAAMMGIRRLER